MAMTKLELSQINTRLAADNAALRTQLSVAQIDVDALRAQVVQLSKMRDAFTDEITSLHAQMLNVTSVASAVNRMHASTRTVRMHQARAEAMATGRTVKA